MRDIGQFTRPIASDQSVGTAIVSRLSVKVRAGPQKSSGGRRPRFSPVDVCHVVHLITSLKANNAAQVTRALCNITSHPLQSNTIRYYLKIYGRKVVAKKKHPLLFAKNRKARLIFIYAYKDWTNRLE
jgi:hypothetical protein